MTAPKGIKPSGSIDRARAQALRSQGLLWREIGEILAKELGRARPFTAQAVINRATGRAHVKRKPPSKSKSIDEPRAKRLIPWRCGVIW